MSNENVDHEDREHWIKELEQEKFFSEEIINYLEKNNTISQKVFDSLSHELRTPVVAIKAYIDMLLEGKFGDLTPEQKEKLERIKENTNMLILAILKLLDEKDKGV